MKNTLKRILILLLSTIIIFSLSSCGKVETTTNVEVTTTLVRKDVKAKNFKFAAYKSGVIGRADIYYDDSYFNVPSTTLSKELTSASICLALSGFSVVRGNDYSMSPKYANELLTNLGFTNFKSNEDGKSRPTDSSFGVYMGMKEIGDYTLIAVTTRGSNYGWEWASNLTVGKDGDFATGFYDASTICIDSIKSYIKENNIKGKIKIWATGYSRSAAVVNLSIGRIDEALTKNNYILGEDVLYTIDDIYAYTYEAPRGRVATVVDNKIIEKGQDYSNIHNFVNPNDFITYYMFREYGFVRYGVDHYLPTTVTSVDYSNHATIIKDIIKKYSLDKCASEYIIDDFKYDDSSSSYKKYNWTLGLFAQTFFDELSIGIGSRENFSDNTNDFFNEFFSLIYKDNAPSDNLYIVFDTVKGRIDKDEIMDIAKRNLYGLNNKMWTELKPVVEKIIKGTCLEEMGSDKFINLLRFVYDSLFNTTKLKEGLSALPTLTDGTNLKTLICAHYAEMSLANVLAMDDRYHSKSNDSTSSTGYYKLVVNTPNQFKITSLKNNKTVLSFLSSNNSLLTTLAIEKYNSGYTIYLPSDSLYKVECEEELIGAIYYIGSEYEKEFKIDNGSSIISGNITFI